MLPSSGAFTWHLNESPNLENTQGLVLCYLHVTKPLYRGWTGQWCKSWSHHVVLSGGKEETIFVKHFESSMSSVLSKGQVIKKSHNSRDTEVQPKQCLMNKRFYQFIDPKVLVGYSSMERRHQLSSWESPYSFSLNYSTSVLWSPSMVPPRIFPSPVNLLGLLSQARGSKWTGSCSPLLHMLPRLFLWVTEALATVSAAFAAPSGSGRRS